MIPIKHRNLEKLAQRHWEAVKEYFFREKTTVVTKQCYLAVDTWVKKNLNGIDFEGIVKAKPSELKRLKQIIDTQKLVFPDEIKNLKELYKVFAGKNANFKNTLDFAKKYNAPQLVEELDIQVCPYCNRNYIQNMEFDEETKTYERICELDHFYHKDKYPFLALSFYNLIPSCKTCNQTFKGTKEISVNPYEMELNYNFKLKLKNVAFYHSKEGFYLDYSDLEKKLGKNFTVFELKKLYNTHKDQVLELIQKQIVYSDEYIDDLFSRYEGTLFKNREDVIRHISGNYVDEDNFHLRPLSKLTHDIAQELGLID